MKTLLNPKYLPWYTLGFGFLAMIPALFLSLNGGTLPFLLLCVLALLLGGVLLWLTRDLKQAAKFSFNFPASLSGAIGTGAAGAGILAQLILRPHTGDFLGIACTILGVAAAAALFFMARCRYLGLHPSVVFPAAVCLFLMVDLICIYRVRSADPQVWHYCFSLLASVCLMLASYYDAAFAANMGDRRKHTLSRLAALFLCMVSIMLDENAVFYLAMGVWMFTGLCSLLPMPRSRRKAP